MNEPNKISPFRAFAEFYRQLNLGTDESSQLVAIHEILSLVSDEDKLMIIRLLKGWRPKKSITQDQLRDWLADHIDLPKWLLREAHAVSGDWVETLSLSWPDTPHKTEPKRISVWIRDIQNLVQHTEEEQKSWLIHALTGVSRSERVVLNRLLTGNLTRKVKRSVLVKAISNFIGLPIHHVAHRFLDQHTFSLDGFKAAFETPHHFDTLSEPSEFHKVIKMERMTSDSDLKDTIYETGIEGMRVQMICRSGHVFLWNDRKELISDRFPEFEKIASTVPFDFVLDGVVMFIAKDRSRATELLEKRLTNKIISPKRENAPVVFVAQDIMEKDGLVMDEWNLLERKKELTKLVKHLMLDQLLVSDYKILKGLEQLTNVRPLVHPCGILLKRIDSKYGSRTMPWTLVMPERLSAKALLLYVSRTSGWASSGFSELTFGMWKNQDIVPVAKVKCEISDEEQKELFQFVKHNTIDRFGPVRSVAATQVFEVSFEAVYEAQRRKSGLSLKEPRVEKWCKKEAPQNASQLADLRKWL